MLLRSSSTPVLGSLLPSISDSPNNSNIHHQSELHGSTQKHTPSSVHGKLSCTSGGSQNFSKSLFHSPSLAENGFRRVQSEGNLEELPDASYHVDEFSLSRRSARRTSGCNLEAIPSFSLNHLGTRFEDDDSDYEEEFDGEKEEGNDAKLEFEDSSKLLRVEKLVLEQLTSNVNKYGSLSLEGEGKMYLAIGLGVSSVSILLMVLVELEVVVEVEVAIGRLPSTVMVTVRALAWKNITRVSWNKIRATHCFSETMLRSCIRKREILRGPKNTTRGQF